MSKTETGGPAFPSPGVVLQNGQQQGAYEGMTLRDYFAAKAMQAHIVASIKVLSKAYVNEPDAVTPIIAQAAYEQADAMLKAREA